MPNQAPRCGRIKKRNGNRSASSQHSLNRIQNKGRCMASWLTNRTDLRAGEWKHEILWRGLCAMVFYAAWLESLCVFIHRGLIADGFVTNGILGIAVCVGLVEGIVRKSLLMGLLTWLCMSLAFIAAGGLSSYYFDRNSHAMGMLIGGAMGFCIGLGSKVLFACMLGAICGQAGGLLLSLAERYMNNVYAKWSTFAFIAVLCVLLAILIAMPCGLAVWVGVKFSRRGVANPPGAGAAEPV